jgi:hypothetical protein
MRKLGVLIVAAALVGGLGSYAFAQAAPQKGPAPTMGEGPHWRGSSGWGAGSAYNRLFNRQTVGSIEGQIVSLARYVPAPGMSPGVHMRVKTMHGVVDVHLGPAWFIESQDLKLVPGDHVRVTGSDVTFEGKPAIIATRVTKGPDTLMLRDSNGHPFWAGWRRGR